MSASFCHDQEGWGPTSSSRADITLCFESTILLGLPAILAILAFAYRAYNLVHFGKRHGLGRTWAIYIPSQILTLATCAVLVARAVTLSNQTGGYAPASMFGNCLLLVAWFMVLPLNHLESLYEIRSSSYIFSHSTISAIAAAISVRTMHDLQQTQSDQYKFFVAYLSLNLAGFVVEAWPRGKTVVQKKSGASAYDKANLFSRLSYHFLQRVVSLGYQRPLTFEDVDGLMPANIRTEVTYPHLSNKWEQHLEECKAKGRKPSLMRIILGSYGQQWAGIMVLRILTSVMTYVSPQLLNRLLYFIESYKVKANADGTTTIEPKPVALGIILAFGMFFSSLLVTFMTAQFYATTMNLGIEIRTALISMIYRKSLKLSNTAKNTSSSGDIQNHMSVDAERWPNATTFVPMMISVPFEIAIAIWMLYQKVGWPVFVGLGSVVAMLPFHAVTAKLFGKIKSAKLAAMDGRLRAVNEVLAGMKIVKLYNWENSFKDKLTVARRRELDVLKRIGKVFSLMSVAFASTPLIIALVTFSCYATVGGPNGTRGEITPQVIFVSTTLFGLLSRPVSMLSQIMNQVISVSVATTRIQKFLLAEEVSETVVEREEEKGQTTPVVEIKDGVFAWCKEHPDVETEKEKNARLKEEAKKHLMAEKEALKAGKPVPVRPPTPEEIDRSPLLTDINLQVRKGEMMAVVGRVGQGKTSLLSALIGDMYRRQGTVRVRGRVTYAAQTAWIINASLKDNIVFGLEFDQKKYDHIVFASGLLPDIAMLPGGDATEIGERGINLSGGQKQRVSLARAAYQDADVYLFDDPLSAVDAHVDQHLWQNLIGPNGLLKDKTRILVTHGIHHLEEVSQIVVVKDGKIGEQGHYDDLMAAKGAFRQLIDEYSVNSRRKKGKESTESSEEAVAVDAALQSSESSEDSSSTKEDDETALVAVKADEKLVQDEKMEKGSVSWDVYRTYLGAASYTYSAVVVMMLMAAQGCQIGTNIWLEHWTNVTPDGKENPPAKFLGVYAALIVVYMILNMILTYIVMVWAGLRASERLHVQLLDNILRLPMSFFDTTPLGRITNRFSTDIYAIDDGIPWGFMSVLICAISILGTIIVIGTSTPIFLAMVPPLGVCFVLIQVYYMRSSRALKRIDSISRSPIYQHFSETLTGVSTIRAMNVGPAFIAANESKTNVSANAYFSYITSNRWLQIRIESVGATIILGAGLFAVLSRDTLNPSMVGLALSYALTVTEDITWMVRSYCDLANQMVSVERLDEYVRKNQEAPSDLPSDANLPETWPQEGRVTFKNYSTRYRQGLELVIKSLSFEVQAAEKIGIVGRTGAGKSSLTLALFRIVEAANSHWAKASHNGDEGSMDTLPTTTTEANEKEKQSVAELEKVEVEEDGGSIWIDGVDISTVGLSRLRQSIAIIPQDPTLFAGTVRENLDPFEECQDADLWEALERAHLKEYISGLTGGLLFMVSQNGDNFSVGQRSLICLARALLRKTKILVLDEATAAVDVETDELIQKTIRKEFKDRTILTIAHRIKTVMDSDKILVLEKGRVEEFESPASLLQNKSSLFYNLAQQAGEIKDEDE